MSLRALRLKRIERNVVSLDRAIAFYGEALGFEMAEGPRTSTSDLYEGRSMTAATLRLGAQEVQLTQFAEPGRPYPEIRRSDDPWFQHFALVTSDIRQAWQRLAALPFLPVSTLGPVTLPESSGGVSAVKFRDSDGHPLELLQFPSGTGDPRWRQAGRLMLGIDHSAIVVADAETSIGFYRHLGFSVAVRQVNHGETQARLDGLAKPVVEVIALTPADERTPHLELLAYRSASENLTSERWQPWDIAGDRLVWQAVGGGEKLLRDPDGHWHVLES